MALVTPSESKDGRSSNGKQWSVVDSKRLYGIDRWGLDYFDVSKNGNVEVNVPVANGSLSFELTDVIDGLKQRGLEMPVMLRVENLLADRLSKLNAAFSRAIEEKGYQGRYCGVYPIKVNQQQHVVSELVKHGSRFGHGLEAGSKAELLIAMSTLNPQDSLIVCNGYKDHEFIDLGLQARRIGYNCFFVVEAVSELDVILDRAKHWDVKPQIGVRLKLSTQVDGHWNSDSGDRSLFGLTAGELIKVVDLLKAAGMLDCLNMVHFHLGSQIPNIRNIRDGVSEACRFYIDLIKEGAPLGFLDLGGGLAVDYDGTRSINSQSRNYDLDEYCADLVSAVVESLAPHEIEHPVIVTESGRWTVAPMTILMFNILSVSHFESAPIPQLDLSEHCEPIASLMETLKNINPERLQENYHDAIYYRDQLRTAFQVGEVDLRERALGENICLTILNRVAMLLPQTRRPPSELANLPDQLSDIYYGNFSVFQSLPDAWAIGQVFPAMPLHRLNEKPTRRAIIADLTCDCDGKLNRFVSQDGEVTSHIPLHGLKPGEDYYIGVFLVGAYQETLGDFHNLFGDTNVASVRLDESGNLDFVHELNGDSISDVLSYVEFQPNEMLARFRAIAENAVRSGAISVAQRQQMLKLFGDSLRGNTYFETD